MAEILTTVAYVSGGLALGFLVELPIYNAITSTRERYNAITRMNRA
jgi:hypothetical protein